MGLQKRIKADLITAMKNKDGEVKDLLRVVLGEIDTTSKKKPDGADLTDSEVLSILGKMKKDAIISGNTDEIKILDGYLPTMLGEKQLETIILGIITSNGFTGKGDMGKVMGILKSDYDKTYDGKLASQIVMSNL